MEKYSRQDRACSRPGSVDMFLPTSTSCLATTEHSSAQAHAGTCTMDLRSLTNANSDATTAQVAAALSDIREASAAETLLDCCSKLTIPVPMKAKLLAALWMTEGGRPVLQQLLARQPAFACPMTLRRASELLDLPRKMRLLERKLAGANVKRARRVRMREALQTLATENVPATFSAS